MQVERPDGLGKETGARRDNSERKGGSKGGVEDICRKKKKKKKCRADIERKRPEREGEEARDDQPVWLRGGRSRCVFPVTWTRITSLVDYSGVFLDSTDSKLQYNHPFNMLITQFHLKS